MKIIPPNHDTSEPAKSIPHSILVDIQKLETFTFVLKVQQLRSSIDEQLAQKKAKLDWSATFGTKVRVKCHLRYNSPNIRKLANTWESDVTEIVETFFGTLECKTVVAFEQTWEEFLANFTCKSIIEESAKKADTISLEVDKNLCSIKLVGLFDEVNTTFEKLKTVLSNIQEKNNIASKYIVDYISNLKPYQFELFSILNATDKSFLTSLNLNVNVEVDGKNKLKITGMSEYIPEAKLKIVESLQTIPRSLDILPEFTMLLKQEAACVQELKESLIDCEFGNLLDVVWELGDNCIVLHAINEPTARKGIIALSNNIQEIKLLLDEACRNFAFRDNWHKLISIKNRKIQLSDLRAGCLKYSKDFDCLIVSELASTVLVKFDEQLQCINFFGIKTSAESARELVHEFLRERAIYENFIRFAWVTCKYINLRYSKDLNELQQDNAYDSVRICVNMNSNKPGIAVRGRKMILETIVSKLRVFASQAYKKKYTELNRDRYQFYQSHEGKLFLQVLEKKYKVAILSDIKSILKYKEQLAQITEKICEVKIVFKPASGPKRSVNIVVLLENIVSLPVDAIINAANANLQLIGGVAGAILKNGEYSLYGKLHLFIY